MKIFFPFLNIPQVIVPQNLPNHLTLVLIYHSKTPFFFQIHLILLLSTHNPLTHDSHKKQPTLPKPINPPRPISPPGPTKNSSGPQPTTVDPLPLLLLEAYIAVSQYQLMRLPHLTLLQIGLGRCPMKTPTFPLLLKIFQPRGVILPLQKHENECLLHWSCFPISTEIIRLCLLKLEECFPFSSLIYSV